MKIGVYFCDCGTIIKEKIDSGKVREAVMKLPHDIRFKTFGLMCSVAGKDEFYQELRDNPVDRVVVAACSPRDHEGTFMKVMVKAGMNPYLMQMVNIREQVGWVTEDPEQACQKTISLISAAVGRVVLHEALVKKEIDASSDALIIGAGPAGLKAALSLAEAGRRVTLVEKGVGIGGLPVRYEEIFPNMECGPCMLEPILGDVMHGEAHENIEILTLAEVSEVVGFFGNFTAKIRRKARHVDLLKCVGCGECFPVCPVSAPNPYNHGLDQRKAIALAFTGSLPNVPYLDESLCVRHTKGEDCRLCQGACPVPGTIVFEEKDEVVERRVGAVILALGASLYDVSRLPGLGYGKFPDVYTNLEFERLAAVNGPTAGEVKTKQGKPPKSLALIHCAGSLDSNHKPYCSGVCCMGALKINHLMTKRLPELKVAHFYKELSVPGKDESELCEHARHNPNSSFIRYDKIDDLKVSASGDRKAVSYRDASGKTGVFEADIVVLFPALVPAADAADLGEMLGVARDRHGFFAEMHGRVDSASSKVKGVFLAGTCQSPMDIQKAMNQGEAASGHILSGLTPGKKLEINAIHAVVNEERCSGCRVCVPVCPYKAISFDANKEVAVISDVLCQACGTCVAGCPAGAIKGKHFTAEQILAEIEGVLS